jgi:PAS domain S-box-containing protein
MEKPLRILHLEDNPLDAELIEARLRSNGIDCEITVVDNKSDFTVALKEREFDVILSDHGLPMFDGGTALAIREGIKPGTPFIFVTGSLGEERAIETLKSGATDFVLKDHLHRLAPAVSRALREARLQLDRRRAEEALVRSQASLSNAQRIAHLGSFERNLATNEIACSDEILRIFGINPQEFSGRMVELVKYIHPDDKEAVDRAIAESIEKKTACALDYRILRADGSVRHVHLQAETTYDGQGKAVLLAGTLHDATEQHSLENQLRQAQKMEAVGRLAGGVAHDFNNLLTVINGYSDLLLTNNSMLQPFEREFLEEIKRAGERAARLTRQLLAFSRQQVLHPQILDLNSVVHDIGKMLRRLIGEDVELQTVAASGLGTVKADPGQMEQVLMNLVVNARDAMPKGGRLIIETSNVEIDESYVARRNEVRAGRYVVLAVSDTGVGMDEEVQRHIFEPFFTTKEKGQGTGLGLATVYGIVKQSGGYIWVYSEVGVGTIFRLYFPRLDVALQANGKADASSMRLDGTETILLVEDDRDVRDLARRILTARGYEVIVATRAEEAIDLAQGSSPHIHLLLTDVIMPGKSGHQLAKEVASIRPKIKTLFMSGYTDRAILEQGILDNPSAFIQKPFNPTGLLKKVREALDQEAPGIVSS